MALSNRTTRIFFALIAAPIAIGITLYGGIPFLVFGVLIGILAYSEFDNFLIAKEIATNKIFPFTAVLLLITNTYFDFIDLGNLILVIIILLTIVELFRKENGYLSRVGGQLLGILYIGLFSGALIELREFFSFTEYFYYQGAYLLIGIMSTIWICDSAAYFLGLAFGKHKIFPRVSPKKSWEGSIAGLVFSIIAMLSAKALILDFIGWDQALIISLIIGIMGQVGDFVESIMKRDAEVKDSSALLPGHGGVLDRLDSLLFTAPIIYLYLSL
ncbi:MAG: phosphatidate cytidylyltransferase [Melioribacteraceae bacterium]|nr:phosphatidate cytidylyltransferase [Melioribacteraceae bacterium]MCF8431855.1 phosphatidate cytidylyltransferase [Melioribacteraceae bacterium]